MPENEPAALTLKIKRLHPRAVLPTKAHPGDAGWDLYSPDTFRIESGGVIKLDLAFCCAPPAGWCAVIRGRSGLAARGLLVHQGLIDPGYAEPWGAVLINSGPHPVTIDAGMRVAQFTLHRIPDAELIEADEVEGDRGGFGSSGA